jgi:hypothetical protein
VIGEEARESLIMRLNFSRIYFVDYGELFKVINLQTDVLIFVLQILHTTQILKPVFKN